MLQMKNKSEFYKKLENDLMEFADLEMILMGDLNRVMSLEMDRTIRKKDTKEGRLPKAFFELVDNFNLIDIWRTKHWLDREFTFHSDVYESSSRIHTIWVSKELEWKVRKIQIQW